MSSSVEKIKARLGVEEVVRSYIKLEKAGVNFKARCPFHNEKTPSFIVSPTRGSYHCFGCNRGGDLITFVQEIEGLDFVGALRVLAERAGVTLETYNKKAYDERARLFALTEDSTNFFIEVLSKNAAAKKYLKERGLEDETIKDFRLGYAPKG